MHLREELRITRRGAFRRPGSGTAGTPCRRFTHVHPPLRLRVGRCCTSCSCTPWPPRAQPRARPVAKRFCCRSPAAVGLAPSSEISGDWADDWRLWRRRKPPSLILAALLDHAADWARRGSDRRLVATVPRGGWHSRFTPFHRRGDFQPHILSDGNLERLPRAVWALATPSEELSIS